MCTRMTFRAGSRTRLRHGQPVRARQRGAWCFRRGGPGCNPECEGTTALVLSLPAAPPPVCSTSPLSSVPCHFCLPNASASDTLLCLQVWKGLSAFATVRLTSRAGCQPPGPGRRHSVIGQRNLTVPLSEEWTWAAEMGLLSHGPPPPRGDARRSGRRAASARPDGTHAQGRSQRTGCAGTRHHTPSGCKGHDCIASRLGQSARTQVSPGSVGAAVLSGRSGGRHPCSSSRRGRQNPAACGCRADVPVF